MKKTNRNIQYPHTTTQHTVQKDTQVTIVASCLETMMSRSILISLLLVLLACASTSYGFVVKSPPNYTLLRPTVVSLEAHRTTNNKIIQMATAAAATAATVVLSTTSPLIALAEEDYEYGAVNAPIGLAWGVGVLAILTALLPIALRGGEEAFEEMKDRDKDKWGKREDKE